MDGREFQMKCYLVMESKLTTLEKFVLIAGYLYEGNPSTQRIARGTGLHPQIIEHLQTEIAHKSSLISPEWIQHD